MRNMLSRLKTRLGRESGESDLGFMGLMAIGMLGILLAVAVFSGATKEVNESVNNWVTAQQEQKEAEKEAEEEALRVQAEHDAEYARVQAEQQRNAQKEAEAAAKEQAAIDAKAAEEKAKKEAEQPKPSAPEESQKASETQPAVAPVDESRYAGMDSFQRTHAIVTDWANANPDAVEFTPESLNGATATSPILLYGNYKCFAIVGDDADKFDRVFTSTDGLSDQSPRFSLINGCAAQNGTEIKKFAIAGEQVIELNDDEFISQLEQYHFNMG